MVQPSSGPSLEQVMHNGQMPQAALFVGQKQATIDDFISHLGQKLVCTAKQQNPCGQCIDCSMVLRGEHPDIEVVKPEKRGSGVKIDVVRALQQTAYLSPQRASQRLICIADVCHMNTAATNALLKILEEPPTTTSFVLTAGQLNTVLPTILSRCHIHRFYTEFDTRQHNLLSHACEYPNDSPEGLIFAQLDQVLSGLIAVCKGAQEATHFAGQWNKFDFSSVLWLFYLIFAEVQILACTEKKASGPGADELITLKKTLNVHQITIILQQISSIIRKISHNVNVNQQMALESIVIRLIE